MYISLFGSTALIVYYLIDNAEFASKMDSIIHDTEEDEEEAEQQANKTKKNIRDKIIYIWQQGRKAYVAWNIFWSRVPTKYELEHRQMASLCCVVEDGREMMDAAQFAKANADVTSNVADKKYQ